MREKRMFYTCILRSISHPEQRYTGVTADLQARLAKHNAGEIPHTSKFKPWKIETAIAFHPKRKPVRLSVKIAERSSSLS